MSAGYTSTARWFRVVTTAIAVAASIAMRGSGEASDSLTVHDYFRNRILTDALVSPTGKFLGLFGQHWTGEPLYSSSTGNEYQRNSTISVRHNETKTTEVVFDFSGPIRYFAWIDDDTLFISYEDTFGTYNRFVDVSFSDGELVFVRREKTKFCGRSTPKQKASSTGRRFRISWVTNPRRATRCGRDSAISTLSRG
jgi:hypothetical protein